MVYNFDRDIVGCSYVFVLQVPVEKSAGTDEIKHKKNHNSCCGFFYIVTNYFFSSVEGVTTVESCVVATESIEVVTD